MKKLITLLFAVGLVTAASAQSGRRNDSRSNDNSYQSSPYSNNDQNGYSNQYSGRDQDSRNSQWNGRGDRNRFDRDRQRAERMRYEMMMRRNRARYHHSYVPYRKPVFQLSIGIGGRR